MTHAEYFTKLHSLHAPLRRQQARTNATGLRYGSNSKEYATEFRKEAGIITALSPQEWELWCSFCTTLFEEMVKIKGKPAALASIIEMAQNLGEDQKPVWRTLYKKIAA